MPTLLLRLVAPMQSWGVSGRFTVRDTAREPSKSGVVGILAAALGRSRTAPLDDLAALRMGVRIDKPGRVEVDYHTAQQVYRANPKARPQETAVSRRYYLADAAFLAGLESDDTAFLTHLHQALRNPRWTLYLGRKAFVPAEPIWLQDGLRDTPLLQALANYPWLGRDLKAWEALTALRVMLEDPQGPIIRYDHPISFRSDRRRYAPRRLSLHFTSRPPFQTSSTAEEVS